MRISSPCARPAICAPMPGIMLGTLGERETPEPASSDCGWRFREENPMASISERFWSKVDRSGGPDACWEWTGAKNNGYGWFKCDGKSRRASRVVWELEHGDIPGGLLVCHHCDNRACVNPAHLFLGTALDNNLDMIRKLRDGPRVHPERRPRGERHGCAKLACSDVEDIRRRYARGGISQGALAQVYSVSQSNVWKIVNGITWGVS